MGADITIGEIPKVQWWCEFGHGDAVWRQPPPALAQIAGTPMEDYSLPARGMVWRTNSREFRIGFRNRNSLGAGTLTNCTLQVSILPCCGQSPPLYPRANEPGIPIGGVVQPFPMEANEWKLTDAEGRPLTIAGGVTLVGIAGALFGPLLYTEVQEWLPIPFDAVGYQPADLVWAAFR